MRGRLNLASRPFRNEALPNLLFVAGLLAVLGLTALHVAHLRALQGEGAGVVREQVRAQEAELQSLREQLRGLRLPAPEASRVAEWRVVKDLVDRRTFSWTLLLARLESALPPGIRLVAIAPRVHQGEIELELNAIARSREDGFEFARALQELGHFRNVYPSMLGESPRGQEFTLMLRYKPVEGRP